MKRITSAVALIAIALGLTLNAAGAPLTLTEKEAKALAATASTPEEHLKLAGYYRQMAEKFRAESKKHEEMKASYESNRANTSSKFKASTIDHCQYFIKSFRENAQKAVELASAHEEMAKSGK
jgi:tryptophanyl-tRNA synthetase